MSLFNLLPPEVLKYILLLTDRKTIKSVYELFNDETIKYMPSLKALLDERKLQYPRLEGQSVLHHVPESIVPEFVYKFWDPKFTVCHESNKSKISDLFKYLEDIDADLVKGDIIVIDSKDDNMYFRPVFVTPEYQGTKFIFDGYNIVDLYSEPQNKIREYTVDGCRYFCLPPEWHIIENNIPLNYWNETLDNKIVWFDHNLILDQCIQNLKYSKNLNNFYEMKTNFTYQGTEYLILFYVDQNNTNIFLENGEFIYEEVKEEEIDSIKLLLISDMPLAFKTAVYWSQFCTQHPNILYH